MRLGSCWFVLSRSSFLLFLDVFKAPFSASRGRFMSGVSILVSQDKGVASVESVEPLLSALGLSGFQASVEIWEIEMR